MHQIKYFKGIIFLTTNILLNIDYAIISRMYLILYYNSLDKGVRERIQKVFLYNLKLEEGDFNISALAYFKLNSQQVGLFLFRGVLILITLYQIRNTINIAQASANQKMASVMFANLEAITKSTKLLALKMSLQLPPLKSQEFTELRNQVAYLKEGVTRL